MRISDWSSDVCSSDLRRGLARRHPRVSPPRRRAHRGRHLRTERAGRAALPARRPRQLDDLQDRQPATRPPWRRAVPPPAPREPRQPPPPTPVTDVEIPPPLPQPTQPHPPTPPTPHTA